MSASLTAIEVEPHECPSHHSILLTQGPICEILEKIVQLLVVVEKLGFFEFFFPKKFFFALFLFKLVNIHGIARIFQNFDDIPDFQQKARGV